MLNKENTLLLQKNILARLDSLYPNSVNATKELAKTMIPIIVVALQEYEKLIQPPQQPQS